LVYLSGVALSRTLRRHARALVAAAAAGAALWGLLGLTVLPRLDVAGALGVPLLLLFLWRSESRAAYAGVFAVVAVLELYGTAIGTWRWTEALPGLGIPDGNPPSGAASGYVCFDVAALLVAPVAFHRMAHPDGEAGTARAAAAVGTLMCLSTIATATPAEVAAAAPGAPRWFQLYVFKDWGLTEALVGQAVEAGFSAL